MFSYLSTRGNKKIIHLNYEYNLYECKEETMTCIWRCVQRKPHCSGCLTTCLNKNNEIEVISASAHNHEADEILEHVVRIEHEVYELAKTSTYNTADVYRKIIDRQALELCERLNKKKIYKNIQNIRNKNKILIENPSIDLPDIFKKTIRNDLFLNYNGLNTPSKLLIFATDKNLLHLKNSITWILDGTFFMAPNGYYQVYVIFGIINSKPCPLLYAFLLGKSLNHYKTLFMLVKELIGNVEPKYAVFDYEIASFSSFSQIFVTTKIFNCLFHLGKNFNDKINELGLKTLYNNDLTIKSYCKMILSIAFCPLNVVIKEFYALKTEISSLNNEKMNLLVIYFENTYINSKSYPISAWNAVERLFNDIPLTTNGAESFNRYFNTFSTISKPSLESIINVIKTIQNSFENDALGIILNPEKLRKNSITLEKYDKLKLIIEKYEEYYGNYFLKCIMHTYNWSLK